MLNADPNILGKGNRIQNMVAIDTDLAAVEMILLFSPRLTTVKMGDTLHPPSMADVILATGSMHIWRPVTLAAAIDEDRRHLRPTNPFGIYRWTS